MCVVCVFVRPSVVVASLGLLLPHPFDSGPLKVSHQVNSVSQFLFFNGNMRLSVSVESSLASAWSPFTKVCRWMRGSRKLASPL